MKGRDFSTRMVKRLAALACAALAACAQSPSVGEHPLVGKIWDTRAGRFIPSAELFDHAARAQHVLLGETHDNAEQHRLQRVVLEGLAARGRGRLLAMEQFDSDYQTAIDSALRSGANAEALADAAHFDRKGWNWPLYRPLVQFALDHGWPLGAANLSRAEARAIVADPAGSGLLPASLPLREALERDLIDGHCGAKPEAKQLAGMVEAQRARDARMAQVLAALGQRGSVLISGIGHARRDRGVPLYLGERALVSIGFMEVQDGKTSPQQYFDGFASPASFDYIWFTPRAPREDPCAR
jgi:uncharacterized iron-regulated protein